MGYFANGTEGEIYEAEYCSRCVHKSTDEKPCAVWMAHFLKNYEECNNDKSILHMLIPISKDGLHNLQCRMFLPRETARFIR